MFTRILLLISLLCAGCSATHLPQNTNPQPPITNKTIQQARTLADITSEGPAEFSSRLIEQEDDYSLYQCSVIPDVETGVDFKYYRSNIKEDRLHPLIIIFNILKDKKLIISSLLAEALVEEGFDCVIMQQEYFLSKKWIRPINPDGGDRLSYDEYNANLARNVGRIIHHWMPKQPSLDGRYGFVGVSMGGMHAIGSAALFPDAVQTVAIMAGADSVDLFKSSSEDLAIHNREQLIEKHGSGETVYAAIEQLIFDPAKLAPAIATDKIKLMITLQDTSVPTRCQWKLYHALRGPETYLFDCGHYTMALRYFTIKQLLLDWFGQAFHQ